MRNAMEPDSSARLRFPIGLIGPPKPYDVCSGGRVPPDVVGPNPGARMKKASARTATRTTMNTISLDEKYGMSVTSQKRNLRVRLACPLGPPHIPAAALKPRYAHARRV
jgi:hypothetical protein